MIKYSLVVFFLARPNLLSDPRSKTGKLLNVFNMVVVNFPNDDCVSDSGSRGETENGDPAQTPEISQLFSSLNSQNLSPKSKVRS